MSISSPTVYIWCAHTINPKNPIAIIAYTIPKYPKIALCEYSETTWLIIPKAGKLKYILQGVQKIKINVDIISDHLHQQDQKKKY